ncbi:MAG: aspartate/glutamate racemase family protein [Christensenellales bacterium]|jgi:aspartate/glutamate racemase
MSKKHVCVIQTSISGREDFLRYFKEYDPEIKVSFIMDDTLIPEVMANGAPTKSVRSRMMKYAMAAQETGADLICNQCSSVGEVADMYAQIVDIPVIKIDQAMAEEAVRLGSRISLIATVGSTVAPSRRLIESCAKAAGKEVTVKECLIDGAMAILFAGDTQRHNDMVREVIEAEDGNCDVIVLAQGSMLAVMPELEHIKTPVLTSIPMGVKYICRWIGENLE